MSSHGLLARILVLSATLSLVTGVLPSQASPSVDPQVSSDRDSAMRIARRYVKAHANEWRLRPGDVSDLQVTDSYRTRANGITHVYLQQQVDGIPIVGARATISVRAGGPVLHAASRFKSDLLARTSGAAVLEPMEALIEAVDHVGLDLKDQVEVLFTSEDNPRVTELSSGGVSVRTIPARLVYQPVKTKALRLAWELTIEERSGEHWWSIAVDAETGEVLATNDYVVQEPVPTVPRHSEQQGIGHGIPALRPARSAEDGSSYRVYALPLESPTDGDRSVVQNPADKLTSPHGWHDIDGKPGAEHTTTRGNNVHAYVDYTIAGTALPLMEADGGDDLTFDFPIDFTLPPQAWKDAATTNLFYWSNIIHDLAYRYGFDEVAGNFQVNNYGHKGAADDALRAEAQDGSGFDNANFATAPDGAPPRMQMYLWTTGLAGNATILDGDLDAGVVIHEYGHGISTRLTGGPSAADCLFNAEQGGEGWSDWLAMAFTARKGDVKRSRGIGTYVLGQSNRHQKGIRPTPYSVNKKVNPSTYDTIKTSAVPHGVGYVWATMLWELYVDLVDEYGFTPNVYADWKTGGNNLAIQLVMDGLKMQPCNPGFVDSRDAILAADKALTGGKNQCIIWKSFAKRGLGVRAHQGKSADNQDGKEDKAVPSEC